MNEPDAALLAIFREETIERLDRVVDVLLAAESGAAESPAVDLLFRDVHSIKGNAGMVGFEEARAVAHAMEDLLEGPRERGSLPAELVDPLLRASDAIRRAIDGESGVAADALAALGRADAPAADSGPTPAPVGQPAPPAEPAPAAEPAPPADRAFAAGQPSAANSIRVSADKVDELLDSVGEAALHHRRVEHLTAGRNGALSEELGRGERLVVDLQEAVLSLRTLPLSSITGRFPRAVRDLAREHGKDVRLELSGTETQLDRMVLDGLSETLTHLLNNSVIHGIERPDERQAAGKPAQGRIQLRAEQRGGMAAIDVADDGGGVPASVLEEAARAGSLTEVLSRPGFSTAEAVSESAGRGVGLDAVKTRVEAMGGDLEVESTAGQGTSVTLLLPLTLALLRVLLAERGGQVFGLPLGSVAEALPVERRMSLGGRSSLEIRDSSVALGDLAGALGVAAPPLPERPPALVVTARGERAAATCDAMVGEQDVVVKTLGPLLAGAPGYLGAAILGDGRVALILDPAHLVGRLVSPGGAVAAGAPDEPEGPPPPPKMLVVDDQFTVRELQRGLLEAAGYAVDTARDGQEALAALGDNGDIDLVVTDLQMPNLDGLGLLQAIRGGSEHTDLPVVIMSSLGAEEDRRRGVEAGADAYLVKQDFDRRALLDTVARLIGP